MRCEGCQRLYCLPCMSKHHDQLAQEFQLLFDVQNELKESFDVIQTNWLNNKQQCLCLVEIDRWEENILNRIRHIANQARIMVNEMMMKNMLGIRRRLDQLTFDIEQRQEEGNYLDNDIEEIKRQLEQLNNNIENIHSKIRINSSGTDRIDWNSLINVINEKKSIDNRFYLMEFQDEEKVRSEKFWINLRKFIRNKQFNIEYRNKQNAICTDESITLTAFDARRQTTSSSKEISMLDNTKWKVSVENDSSNRKDFVSINHDCSLPQSSFV